MWWIYGGAEKKKYGGAGSIPLSITFFSPKWSKERNKNPLKNEFYNTLSESSFLSDKSH